MIVEEKDFTSGMIILNALVHALNLFSALLSNLSTRKLANVNVPKLTVNLDKSKIKVPANARSANLNYVESILTMYGIRFFANVCLDLKLQYANLKIVE